MAATGYTPISLYYSTTAAAVPTNSNLVNGELAINITDGKLYYKDNAGVVKLLASNSGSSGDVVGPASATDNAIARFDGTTGKLIQNSAVTIGDTGNTVIEGTDNSNAMLRITQLGTGNALLVEDSTNPDSTPFVINASGKVIQGYTSAITGAGGVSSDNQIVGASATASRQGFVYSSTTTAASFNEMAKSASPTIGTQAIVASSETLGVIRFSGSDGTNFIRSAEIGGFVDGTPGTNDMPGRLVFSTTADGAATPTERMRIDSAGNVGIGSTSPSTKLEISSNATDQTVSTIPTVRLTNTDTTAVTNDITGSFEFYSLDASDANRVSGFIKNIAEDAGTKFSLTFGTKTTSADAVERMRISATGNTAIGTTTTTAAQLTVAGNSSTAALKVPNIKEVITVSATAATGTVNYDITTQSVLYYTSNATGNWTLNFRGSSGTSLDTLMSTGESMSATFLVTNGATAYYNSAVTIDGSSVTPKWQDGSAPTTGNASSIDSYTYVIIKTGSATFTVLASVTQFA